PGRRYAEPCTRTTVAIRCGSRWRRRRSAASAICRSNAMALQLDDADAVVGHAFAAVAVGDEDHLAVRRHAHALEPEELRLGRVLAVLDAAGAIAGDRLDRRAVGRDPAHAE